jgi:hypothetical protein
VLLFPAALPPTRAPSFQPNQVKPSPKAGQFLI